jgi:HEAT repeat protein
VESLTAIREEKSKSVRQAVVAALDKLGGQSENDEASAQYWIMKREWERCIAIGTPALKPLIACLRDKDTKVRRSAVDALGQIGDPRAVDPLIDCLKSRDMEIRRSAVTALGRIGDARAVDPLIALFENSERTMRKLIDIALGKIDWPSDTEESRARYCIMKQAWHTCVEIGTPAVAYLIAALNNKETYMRQPAAEALEKIGNAQVVEALIAVLEGGNVEARKAAIEVLGRIGGAEAVNPLVATFEHSDNETRRLIDTALVNIDWPTGTEESRARYCVMKKAWHTCVEIGTPAVEPLIAALNSKKTRVRQPAAEALEKIGNTQVVEGLIAVLEGENAEARKAAIEVLGRMGDAQAVNPLVETFEHSDNETRRLIDTALVNIDWPTGTEESRARYCVMKQHWHTCVEIGTPAVEPLVAALRDQRDSAVEAIAIAETLGEIGDDRAVEPLIVALKNENKYLRKAVAEALGKFGDARAVNPLILAFQHSGKSVQDAIEVALGNIETGSEEQRQAQRCAMKQQWDQCIEIGAPATAPLAAILEGNKKREVRQQAAEALGKIGEAQAVPALSTALLNDKSYSVREAAAEALGMIGDPHATESLSSGLKEEDQRVREAVVQALGQTGDAGALELLTAILQDTDPGMRLLASKALAKLADSPGLRWQTHWVTIRTLLHISVLDENKRAREAAAKALEEIGKPAVELLIDALKNKDAKIRQGAASTLGQIGDKRAVEAILTTLQDEDGAVRASAASALGQIGDTGAIEALLTTLQDEDSAVRARAAHSLDKLGWKPGEGINDIGYWIAKREWEQCVALGRPAVPPLIACFQDKDKSIRDAVSEALGQIGAPAIEALIAALENEEPRVRQAARKALAHTGAPATMPLIRRLQHRDARIRQAACKVLGQLGDTRAVTPLISALKDQDQYTATRQSAAQALGGIGDSQAVPPLIASLQDDKISVCRAAARALVAIYQSGGLSEPQQRKILEQRSVITQRHQDRTHHYDKGGYYDTGHCRWHNDSTGHDDRGRDIGVNFPL